MMAKPVFRHCGARTWQLPSRRKGMDGAILWIRCEDGEITRSLIVQQCAVLPDSAPIDRCCTLSRQLSRDEAATLLRWLEGR